MVLADWQVGEVFLSFLWFFLFFIWIWLLITVFADIFRDHEMSGMGQGGVGDLRRPPALPGRVRVPHRGGSSMAQRAMRRQQQSQQQFDTYVQSVRAAAPRPPTSSRLADLKSRGVISDAEFEQLKAKAIADDRSPPAGHRGQQLNSPAGGLPRSSSRPIGAAHSRSRRRRRRGEQAARRPRCR